MASLVLHAPPWIPKADTSVQQRKKFVLWSCQTSALIVLKRVNTSASTWSARDLFKLMVMAVC